MMPRFSLSFSIFIFFAITPFRYAAVIARCFRKSHFRCHLRHYFAWFRFSFLHALFYAVLFFFVFFLSRRLRFLRRHERFRRFAFFSR